MTTVAADEQATHFDAALIFGFLSFFQFWGGAAVGAGMQRAPRAAGACGAAWSAPSPLYFGIERGLALGEWGWLVWQVLLFAAERAAGRLSPAAAAGAVPDPGHEHPDHRHLHHGRRRVLGAWFFRLGSEFLSLAAGGIGFLFGAIWFGAGIKQLRGK